LAATLVGNLGADTVCYGNIAAKKKII